MATKKEMFAQVREIVEDTTVENKNEILEFINHEIDLLNRKRSSGSGMTANQRLNEDIKSTILEVLSEATEPKRVGDLMKDSRLSNYGSQKLTSLLKQMKDAGSVVNTIVGKKSFYSVES